MSKVAKDEAFDKKSQPETPLAEQPDSSQLAHVLAGMREHLDRLESFIEPEVHIARIGTERARSILAPTSVGEHRLPVAFVTALAITLQVVLPPRLAFKPVWLLPALESALFVGLVIANPVRLKRSSRPLRTASLSLIAAISLANAWSAVLLVRGIIERTTTADPVALLGTGAAIYFTNVIVFGLWYWEFDRGGPVARYLGSTRLPDLLFPQYTVPELTPPGWSPKLFDYLYVSFTNASAFSPTDVMPMSRWAKALMFIQAVVALTTVALVVARAVNILQ